MKINYLLFSFFLFTFYFLLSPVYAQHFTSPNYTIDWGNFNMTSGRKSSATYQLTDTVGQNAPGLSSQGSLRLKAGFQYIYDTYTELSFTIDRLNLDFGTLTPGVASTATNTLTVTTPSGHGYQIMASENHPLWLNSSLTIPNTSCDNSDCTATTSAPWITTDHYGFGFNAAGAGATGYFSSTTYFRPFADLSASDSPAIIASENSPVKNRQTLINYRLLISSLQAAGDYENYLTYILVPKY